jgi:predicted 3-demethylubiquinone-9 3-methyltransferase (glyoxalase superfamily)
MVPKEWAGRAPARKDFCPAAVDPEATRSTYRRAKLRPREAIMARTTRITPFLWFDDQAEAAANFYTSIFENSRIVTTSRYDEASSKAAGRPKGSVMTVAFELDGQLFTALNGGPLFKFTEAISFVVNCETQAEVDHFWTRLSAGGEEVQCGWLKDRYGVSWQVIPAVLMELLQHRDPEVARRVMAAMLRMKKIDIGALERAAATSSADSGRS